VLVETLVTKGALAAPLIEILAFLLAEVLLVTTASACPA
jgi:hypothetical protein